MKYECKSCYNPDHHFNVCAVEVLDDIPPSICLYGADDGGGELNDICEWIAIEPDSKSRTM